MNVPSTYKSRLPRYSNCTTCSWNFSRITHRLTSRRTQLGAVPKSITNQNAVHTAAAVTAISA